MDRKLASIQKIVSIEPIPEADQIEKAVVLGWNVVVKKGEFNAGDLVVYIETDSIVPPTSYFEFLKERKYRVKTIKLRKQVSQGLIVPLLVLPKGKYFEGDDVTQKLGVKKYDPQGDLELRLAQETAERTNNRINKFLFQYPWYRKFFFKPKRGNWPKFIKKTDEDRIQFFPDIVNTEKDTIFNATEKVDGQSASYFLLRKPKHKVLGLSFGKELEFGVCSRNLHLPKEDNSSYWTIAKQLDIKNILAKMFPDNAKYIVLQGEIIGSRIQGNKYNINGYDFYAFNLFIDGKQFDTYIIELNLNRFNIKTVPTVKYKFKLPAAIDECVELAKGKSVINPDIFREGIVVRNYEKNISFKIINPDFLLKYSE